MHDRAGQRAIGAGPQHQAHVGLFRCGILIDVDDDDLGAACLACLDRVGHDVDLGDHGVGAPDHHAIRLRHLARVGTAQRARPRHPSGPGEIGADRAEEAGVLFRVAQPVDAVALHQTHRAGIVIGPDRLRAVCLLSLEELLGDEVERRVPAGFLPGALALGTRPDQRLQQAVGMMNAVGIAGDLGADDASRVAVGLGAMDAANAVFVEQLDFERAGGRAVVRTGRMAESQLGVLVHGGCLAGFRRGV